MAEGAIYVDDSGNPGAESGSEFLPSARKSWTAVIVPSVVADRVEEGMRIFLDGVRGEFEADELHFTEIFSGNGTWASISVERRAEIINLMARVMTALSLPIVHQSVSEFTMLDHPRRAFSGQTGNWNLNDLTHQGLLMLCSHTSHHIRSMRDQRPADFDLPFPLYVDQSILNAGRDRELPNWEDVIEDRQHAFATPPISLVCNWPTSLPLSSIGPNGSLPLGSRVQSARRRKLSCAPVPASRFSIFHSTG